jgi:hypothetical protein
MSDTPYLAAGRSVLALAMLAHGFLAGERGTSQSVERRPVPSVQDLSAFGSGTRASSVSQFGITWTFSRPHEVGRFANGDWWVLGPVNVTKIDPASTSVSGRVMNGSMIDPVAGAVEHGFDSTLYAEFGAGLFKAGLNVGLNVSASNPLVLPTGKSLVSCVSVPTANALPQLKTAAILTCLASAPPAGSFRPPYVAGSKTIRFNAAQLNYSRLANLTPVASTPALATVERYFERPWIDHPSGWLGRFMHPADNMPDYGRDLTSHIGIGALMLNLNFTDAQKRVLLTRFVQLGIDLHGMVLAGARRNWEPLGGHGSGRKMPILFAGLLLGDPVMSQIGQDKSVLFGEDAQTFVVQETSPGVYNHGYGGYNASDVGKPEWGNRHAIDPSQDVKAWDVDPYRICCTANAWGGIVLAVRIMGQRTAWNHEPLFGYTDRYLQIETIPWRRFWDAGFTAEMWATYRSSFN